MRKSILIVGLFLGGVSYAAPLQIVSAAPKGEMTGQRSPISVTFNQPVAALSEKSAFSSQECPLQITPAVKGTCRFSGTQTVQFEPSDNWPQATAYTVRIAAGFTSRVSKEKLAQEYTWSFETARPKIVDIIPGNKEPFISLRPLIFVQTSQPVTLDSAQQAFDLTYVVKETPQPTWWQRTKAYVFSETLPAQNQTVKVPVTVRRLTEQEYQENFSYVNKDLLFAVQPKKDLPAHSEMTVKISTQLRATKGLLGPEKDFTSVFYTYPALDIAGANVEGCLPFDGHLDFTSPVRLADLLKHITVLPKSALVEKTAQELQTLGYQRTVPQEPAEKEMISHPVSLPAGTAYFAMPLSFLRLEPKQSVTINIDKDLTDIYGQKLGQERTFTVTNNGYCPAVKFTGGLGVLESYLPPRLPIDVLNEKEVEVLAARFDKENFIPFAEKNITYCEQAEINKANVQYSGKYPFQITADKTKKTYLDLKKFNPTAHQSIIFSQVKVPSSHRTNGFCWVGATSNITDLGLTLKTSPANTLVWVTSLQTGEPQANLNVELRDSANHTLWTGSTDANGLAWAPGWKELNALRSSRWSRPVIYAFVSSAGGDGVLASKWDDGLEPWRFNIDYAYNPPEQTLKTALFTDRGVYRPSETVYLKGITRQLTKGQWSLPTAKTAEIKIYNSRGEEIEKQTVSFHQGAFDLAFTIPADAATGQWQVYCKPAQSQEDEIYSFQVEAVKQADFEVHLRALQEAYSGGQQAQFTASADYLFGAPVAGGRIKWSARRANDWFEPKGYEGYIFVPYFLMQETKTEEGLLGSASGQLDAQGQFNFTVPLPKVTRPQKIYTEASVQTPTGQQLFARTQVSVNPADFYLGAYRERWSAEAAEPVKTTILAVNLNGKRIGPVQVKAEITKEEYLSVRKNGLSGRLEWVSEHRSQKIATQSFTVDMNGYEMSFLPPKPGEYRVVLSAKDAQGRVVKGGFEVTVYGKGEAYWKQNDDDILILKSEKDVYQVGENARILVQSPYENATALVSVEREGVLESWTTTVSAGADYIEVPVKASYTPNVFVSVTLVRGRAAQAAYDKEGLDVAKPQGKTGYVQLVVSQQEREITTRVVPNKKNYRPGDEVTVKIHTALQGKPVAADVTFMAVDEGVLALTGYQVPNLMKVFYSLWPLSVLTADNRVFLIGQRNFGEKGENRGGGGGLMSKLGGSDLRSHFDFTPYFNANVRTSAKGKAEIKFKLPDNLTTFRLMAVAATVKEFGAAQETVKVSKPVMLTAKLPRFARRGDEFECGAVIFNYEDEKGQITLSAQAQGAIELTEHTQVVHVDKGAAQTVYWPCKARQSGPATIKMYAQAGKASDGVQTVLQVSEIEKKQTLSLYSATENTEDQVLEKPASVNEQLPSEVVLSMASTALLNLRGSMLYLLTYPYDCLEQKMSKILPIIEGDGLIAAFKLGDSTSYKQQAQTILQQIPSYQDISGGLAYWPGQLPDPYVTAYALETAYRAKQAGFTVPDPALQKAAAWLKGIFTGRQAFAYPYTEAENQTVRAYGVYVLALYGEKLEAQFSNLYTRRNALSVEANSYLLQAAKLLNKGAEVEKNLAQELLNHIQYGAQTLHFAADETQVWLHTSAVKNTARALEALLQSGDYLPQPYQAVHWLLTQLNAQGHWKNTVDNAAVFSALHTYYRLKEAQAPDFKAEAALDGKIALTERFEGRSVQTKQAVWPLPQVYANGTESRLQVSKTGSGTLYYTVSQNYAPLAYTEPVNTGFAVSREITDLQGNPVTTLRSAERYKVTLKTVTSTDYSFVVLEDFIPAGVELVNSALATESQLEAETNTRHPWGGYERDEKYDDRIAIFANYLTAGEHSYTYLIQAMTPGTFSYPSLWASQMYDPAVFGHSTTATLRIEPS